MMHTYQPMTPHRRSELVMTSVDYQTERDDLREMQQQAREIMERPDLHSDEALQMAANAHNEATIRLMMLEEGQL